MPPMTDLTETTPVQLTAAELLLLRQRLSDGPGTPAVDSVLDEKLYQAQGRLAPSGTTRIAEAMRQANANPGRVFTIDEPAE
jgi:hypothetical protein